MLNLASTLWRPALPIALARCGDDAKRISASARASASPAATMMPVSSWATRSALPPTEVAMTGKAAGHRFEDRVRDAFGQRRQHEAVQPAHDFGNIVALAGEPGEITRAGSIDEHLTLGPQRAVPDDDQPQLLAQCRTPVEGAQERAHKRGLVLHGLHAADTCRPASGAQARTGTPRRAPAVHPQA